MIFSVKKLVAAAVIGALYAALTLVLAPIAYGPLQFRVSEVLCILPFFFPASAVGLTIGCVIANLLGPSAGILDIVFGSFATLLAGICTAAIGMRARKRGSASWGAEIAACFMPVLFNAPIIGAVLAYTLTPNLSPETFWASFFTFGAQVALGEAVVMFALGLPSMRYLSKSPVLRELLDKLK
jgi:Predicted membrane protein